MLIRPAFSLFTHGEIEPHGWLRRQLEIQANGLCGHLDKVWPDVRDSQWIGGVCQDWERVPYWLDGFVPLAYQLQNEDMISRAKRYIDSILERQAADGWLCPCTEEERSHYDLWSGFLVAKVLSQYADLSGDARIEQALYRFAGCMWNFLQDHTLHGWAAMRWFEALIPLFWLYERHPEEWIIRLVAKLEQQGFSYKKLFSPFRDQQPERSWSFSTHGVNLAMALKSGALTSRLDGDDPSAFACRMQEMLFRYHSTAYGHFTSDECLMGDSPVQGSELCGIVEAMYSYEQLLSISGDARWGDCLEKLAFNALPAALSADMWTHQYDQQVNQIRCARLPEEQVIFGTNGPESHLFGLEPHFGCCTANFGQGWPKLTASAFMRAPNGIVSSILVPAAVTTDIQGVRVHCELDTLYPFRNTMTYTVTADMPVFFALHIRIPSCAKSATVNGECVPTGAFHTIERIWSGTTNVQVALAFEPALAERPNDLYALWCGPLLYAVPIQAQWNAKEYTKDGVERKFPYCDYELLPQIAWNYGFVDVSFTPVEMAVSEVPFADDTPPAAIDALLAPVEWEEVGGVCRPQPVSRQSVGDAQTIRMIPYGCARLRMTELPVVER